MVSIRRSKAEIKELLPPTPYPRRSSTRAPPKNFIGPYNNPLKLFKGEEFKE